MGTLARNNQGTHIPYSNAHPCVQISAQVQQVFIFGFLFTGMFFPNK